MFSFYQDKPFSTSSRGALATRLVVFIASVLFGVLFIGTVFSTPTHAAAVAFPDKADKNIQKLLLHRFLGACLKNSSLAGGVLFDNGRRITGNGPANSGDWFQDITVPLSPYFEDTRFDTWKGSENFYNRTAGIGNCGDEATIKLAMNTLGGTGVEILCNIGFVRVDGSPCIAGNGDFKHADNAVNGSSATYNNFVKKYPEPSLDDNGWYWFYRKVFNWTCGYGKMSDAVSKSTADGSPQFGYALTYLTNEAPDFKETRYFIGLETKDKTVTTRLGTGGSATSKVDRTCAQIATHINDYGSKEAARLASLPDDIREDDLNQPPASDDGASGTGTDSSSCAVEGVGWIVCPIMTFTAGIVDAAYGFVTSLLEVQPLLTTGETKGVFDAWEVMRNIANVAFVIAFLIIIFSQLTGMGVSNYGVKKMLPRLVISAILVNISFWVCAIAVDISNILGASIAEMFTNIKNSLPPKENLVDWDSGQGWAGITGAILAGGVIAGTAYIVGLSALIPALIAAVLAIITVFLVLTLRQALIILLIVIAPLAFVAFILPNTEDWFTKWRKLLMTLLLMYPIIAGIFGASALASVIIMNSSNNTIVQIMGACIAIIPLAITPLVMKTAGGVLNRFAGMVNNPNKGPADRLRKAGDKYREGRNNLRNARALSGDQQLGRGAFVRWRARRGAVASGRQQEANRASTEYLAGQVESSAGFRNSVAGGTIGRAATDEASQRALATSINAQSKLEAEELNAATVVLKSARLTQDQNRAIAAGGTATYKNAEGSEVTFNGGTSTAIRAAAIQNSVATNDVAAINSLWNDSNSWKGKEGDQLREAFADSLQGSSARPAYLSQGAIAGLRTGGQPGSAPLNVKSTIEEALRNNTYSPEKIAGADKDELNIVAQVLNENHAIADQGGTPRISDKQRESVLVNAEKALTDARIGASVGKNREQIENIVGFRAPEPNKRVPIEGVLDIHRNQGGSS
ncbi:MAG: hypothetical protein ACREGE_02585 [Candidatus Microsaccharimonas sp.]